MHSHNNTLITVILFFGLTFQGMSQNLVKDYKKVADKSLLEYFDTTVLSKVKCNRFSTLSLDKQGSNTYFYNENRNQRLSFSAITFDYTLFDYALNDFIYFYISVDRKFQVFRDSSIIKKVPLCIRASQPCAFISSDSAKRISIADSIQYADRLSSQLERNKFDKEYYWIITGHKPSGRPKSNKPSLSLYAETISTSKRRIINAQTGQLLNYEQFDYDW